MIYTLPVVGVGYMSGMLLFYLLKFATDVLLIAPGAMGAIFDTPCKAKTKGWSECGFLVPHRRKALAIYVYTESASVENRETAQFVARSAAF